jgi:hypothetical protein
VRRFIAAAATNPNLFIEVLFWKKYNVCAQLAAGYDTYLVATFGRPLIVLALIPQCLVRATPALPKRRGAGTATTDAQDTQANEPSSQAATSPTHRSSDGDATTTTTSPSITTTTDESHLETSHSIDPPPITKPSLSLLDQELDDELERELAFEQELQQELGQ